VKAEAALAHSIVVAFCIQNRLGLSGRLKE
jgi:hypothetical protein